MTLTHRSVITSVDLHVERHWNCDIWFPTGGRLKPSLYLARLLIYCVIVLAEHIPLENALIPIFVLRAKYGV